MFASHNSQARFEAPADPASFVGADTDALPPAAAVFRQGVQVSRSILPLRKPQVRAMPSGLLTAKVPLLGQPPSTTPSKRRSP